MKYCPVSNLPIVERPHWKSVHNEKQYTTHMQRIGDDILLTSYEAGHDITVEFMDKELFCTVLEESGLVDKPVFMLRDLSLVSNVSYAYKKHLTQLIYQWQPNFRCIIFFNTQPEFQTMAETFCSIVPESTKVMIVNDYNEAINAVVAIKAGEDLPEEYEDDEDELYAHHKKDFLAATARIGWLNMLTQPINLPSEDDYLFPFFKAIESLQNDLLEKEKLITKEIEEKSENCEKKIAEKTILLNAQLEMNKKLKALFDRERSILKSRIASQDMELTRVSTAIAEKASTLQGLFEKINTLNIDHGIKQDMVATCQNLIETEIIEKKLNTELTSTDSEFLSKLQRKHPNLNQRDLRIGLLIKLNYDTREIARSIGISTRGLESIRYRMHKKMGLSKHQSIKNYLVDLIAT
ncbi:MAG: transcriptional regulator [Prosthecochloris sp.]|uniref:helix-turn-helix transcriptional regulator n=1 Tax=Prosthecochloris sp. TaxID=290513 RepID=UPI00258F54C1|nr:transcriptional regulator [Prosthecochloris sp.]MCW8797674.1 transcriptional regulator [Prosthecochloris sp.]